MKREEEIEALSAQESKLQYEYMERAKNLVAKQAAELKRSLTFCVVTFGCQMNARDSEKLTGILEQIGYRRSESENADLVIYNTCTVRDNANTRVYGRLGKLKNYKQKNPHMLIALCGCMMQEPSAVEKIKEKYRHVDLIFGTHNIFKFAELLVTRLESERENSNKADNMIIDIWKDTDLIVEDLPVERKYPFKSGVNIMFGCNNFCSYCIVPYVRGRERSRKPQDILDEIRRLVADGVVEIMLLGQNVNSYGKNLEIPEFCRILPEETAKLPEESPNTPEFCREVKKSIISSPYVEDINNPPLYPPEGEEDYIPTEFVTLWDKFKGKRKSLTDDYKDFCKKTEGLVIDYVKLQRSAQFAKNVYFQTIFLG